MLKCLVYTSYNVLFTTVVGDYSIQKEETLSLTKKKSNHLLGFKYLISWLELLFISYLMKSMGWPLECTHQKYQISLVSWERTAIVVKKKTRNGQTSVWDFVQFVCRIMCQTYITDSIKWSFGVWSSWTPQYNVWYLRWSLTERDCSQS